MSNVNYGEGNSSINQDIKSKFVNREVYSNVNGMVEYILSQQDNAAPFTWDDVTNYYRYPEWSMTLLGEELCFDGGDQDAFDNFREEFDRLETESQDLLDEEKISEETHTHNLELISDAMDEFDTLETEPQEVLEWWLVSDWLCGKLKDIGEVVIESENIWGRCGSGQAIKLDYTITQVCSEMGILEGQENSWAKIKKEI